MPAPEPGKQEAMNSNESDQLEQELRQAEAELAEERARMPFHSATPSRVQQLEEIEDKVDALRARLLACRGGGSHG